MTANDMALSSNSIATQCRPATSVGSRLRGFSDLAENAYCPQACAYGDLGESVNDAYSRARGIRYALLDHGVMVGVAIVCCIS